MSTNESIRSWRESGIIWGSVIYISIYVFSSVICKKAIESKFVKRQRIPNQDVKQRCMQDEIIGSINLFFQMGMYIIKGLYLDFLKIDDTSMGV